MNRSTALLKPIYPWVIWFLSACFFYYKYLIQVSPGVMSTQLMSAYALSGAEFGHLAACFFYGYLLMQIPVGILLDRWSPRKITAISVLICALSIFTFANAHSLTTAGLSRFFIGLSASFAAVSCFKFASIWFPPRRFAFIAGLSMAAGMFGAIGGQGPLSFLIILGGWRRALEWVALAGLILSFLIFIIIKDQNSFSCLTSSMENNLTLSDKLKHLLTDKQNWLLSLYSGLAFAPVSVFGGLWGVSFIEKAYSASLMQASNYISFIFIGFAIGCPITGWFSDYIGKRKPIMLLGTVLALISMTLVIYGAISVGYLILLLFIFGFGASCFFLCFSMIRELHPLAFTGTVLGFMNTFDSICEAITEPFIGKLLDLGWDGTYEQGARSFSINDYHHGLAALSIYLIIALILLIFIKETHLSNSHGSIENA